MAKGKTIRPRLVRDIRAVTREDGSVAIEFAYVAPVLLLLTLGVVEVTNMLAEDRKVALANETMIDMVGRLKTVTESDRTEIANAVQLVMRPYVTDYTATVAVVSLDKTRVPDFSQGSGTFQFSVHGAKLFTQPEMLTLATGLGAGNDSVIVGRVNANYLPIFRLPFLGDNLHMQATNAGRPRPTDVASNVSTFPPPPPPASPPSNPPPPPQGPPPPPPPPQGPPPPPPPPHSPPPASPPPSSPPHAPPPPPRNPPPPPHSPPPASPPHSPPPPSSPPPPPPRSPPPASPPPSSPPPQPASPPPPGEGGSPGDHF